MPWIKNRKEIYKFTGEGGFVEKVLGQKLIYPRNIVIFEAITMKKEEKLSRKIKRFLKMMGCPRWLHHLGPKKFEFYQHVFALLVKEVLKLSFRRCCEILKMFDVITPTYSALCKCRKRIPNPSFYFVKRINCKNPVKRYAKLSAFFDLPTRKFTALKARVKPRHDVKDVNCLLKISSPTETDEKLFRKRVSSKKRN